MKTLVIALALSAALAAPAAACDWKDKVLQSNPVCFVGEDQA